jgi:hypothetical protein
LELFMNAAAALRSEIEVDPRAPSPDNGAVRREDFENAPDLGLPSRDQILALYLRLRALGKPHHDNVWDFLSSDWIWQNARRVGLASGRTLVFENPDEMELAADLAIHTAPPGRSRAIERYAQRARFAPDSAEAFMLDLMRAARFGVFSVLGRHPAAGLVVTDAFEDTDHWLVDIGMESTMPEGAWFATRYYSPGPFIMTAGFHVPVDRLKISIAIESTPQLARKSTEEAIQDRRFAEAVYRGAIADGAMEGLQLRDPLDDEAGHDEGR